MWDIRFFKKDNGRIPAKEFIDKLNKREELPYVEHMIDMLSEYGNKLDRPHADLLRDKIHELIISTRYGEIRLLYFFDDKKIYITHGLFKKSKRTSDTQINKAIEYRKIHFKRGR